MGARQAMAALVPRALAVPPEVGRWASPAARGAREQAGGGPGRGGAGGAGRPGGGGPGGGPGRRGRGGGAAGGTGTAGTTGGAGTGGAAGTTGTGGGRAGSTGTGGGSAGTGGRGGGGAGGAAGGGGSSGTGGKGGAGGAPPPPRCTAPTVSGHAFMCGPAVTSGDPDSIDVFAVDRDGKVRWKQYAAGWSSWQLVSGAETITSDLDASEVTLSTYDVFGLGTTGHPVHQHWGNGNWLSAWEDWTFGQVAVSPAYYGVSTTLTGATGPTQA